MLRRLGALQLELTQQYLLMHMRKVSLQQLQQFEVVAVVVVFTVGAVVVVAEQARRRVLLRGQLEPTTLAARRRHRRRRRQTTTTFSCRELDVCSLGYLPRWQVEVERSVPACIPLEGGQLGCAQPIAAILFIAVVCAIAARVVAAALVLAIGSGMAIVAPFFVIVG